MSTKADDKKRPKSLTEAAAHCLAHRIRVEALTILIERVASPTEIAAEIGETVQLVSYHMKILKEGSAIELIEEKKRGAVYENFFRATMRPELSHEEWLELSPRHKQELAIIAVRNLFAENLSSLEVGKMTADKEMYYWWKAVPLDHQGREEVRKAQDAHAALLLEIEAKANARAIESHGKVQQTPTVLAILGFDRGRTDPVNDILGWSPEGETVARQQEGGGSGCAS